LAQQCRLAEAGWRNHHDQALVGVLPQALDQILTLRDRHHLLRRRQLSDQIPIGGEDRIIHER
jgi:hypothetical protein